MLTLAAKIKNIAFLLIAVLVLGLIGYRYADLGRYVGASGYYTVHVQLPETGGLFENANVTYRGVSVGRVGPVTLTADGVRADLRINDSAPRIPSRLHAVVASLSAVGEQYIDLQPGTDSGPYLADGATVPVADTTVPAPVTTVLSSVDGLVGSVPLASLNTVVDELGATFQGQGGNLQALLDAGGRFVRSADQNLSTDTLLISDGRTVLSTQAAEGDALKNFAGSANQLAAQLNSSDADLRSLIANGPGAAEQVSGLLRDLNPELSVVLANLLTTSELGVTRQHGIEELLVRLPQAAAIGSTAVSSKGLHLGMAVTFFAPLPCTAGYGGTAYRNGLDLGTAPAFNTAARCSAPVASGRDVRGSANAPKGGVPTAVQPGSVLSGSGNAGANAGALRDSSVWAPAALPGALALPALPQTAGTDMSTLLGLEAATP